MVHLTKRQEDILYYLFQFRFLSVRQLQQLLNHTEPQRIQQWIKRLKDAQLITPISQEYETSHKGAIVYYHLSPPARFFLYSRGITQRHVIKKLYAEHKRSAVFIAQCQTLLSLYFIFRTEQANATTFQFYTATELATIPYFPTPRPHGYVVIEKPDTVSLYFLEIIAVGTPSFAIRRRVKEYVDYAESQQWQEHTKGTPLPTVLILCPTKKIKQYLHHYIPALLETNDECQLTVFVSTYDQLQTSSTITWERVSM